jgi:hypothetical protein
VDAVTDRARPRAPRPELDTFCRNWDVYLALLSPESCSHPLGRSSAKKVGGIELRLAAHRSIPPVRTPVRLGVVC